MLELPFLFFLAVSSTPPPMASTSSTMTTQPALHLDSSLQTATVSSSSSSRTPMASVRVFMTRRVPTTDLPYYLQPVQASLNATTSPQRISANDFSLSLSPANTSLYSNDTAKIRIRKFSNTKHPAKPFVFETTPPPRKVRDQIPLFAGFKSGSCLLYTSPSPRDRG